MNGDSTVLLRCKCGEISLQAYAWHGLHFTEQFRIICKDCGLTARVVEIYE